VDTDPARAALAAFRDATVCSVELRAENLRGIETRLQGDAPRRNRGIGIVIAVLAAAAVAVLVARGMEREMVAERGVSAESQAVDDVKSRDAVRVVAVPSAVALPPVGTITTTTTTTTTSTPAEKSSPRRGALRVEPSEDLLAREAASLKGAREALARGELDVAERLLAALVREMPQGELLVERRIVAPRLRWARGDDGACATAKNP
jgi:hypothetical protein